MAEADGMVGLAVWYALIGQLEAIGALAWTLWSGDQPWLRLVPGRPTGGLTLAPGPEREALSPMAFVRLVDSRVVLDAPMAAGPVELVHPEALGLLFGRSTPDGGAAAPNGGSPAAPWPAAWRAFLCGASLLTPAHPEPDSPLAGWEFADLLMHQRSRTIRGDQPIGATYPLRGRVDPLPEFRPPVSDEWVALPAPDLAQLERADPPFQQVVEQRRSWRSHGDPPITLAQLGEFLFRVARAVPERTLPPGEPAYPAGFRLAPSGGGCHALEIYPVVGRCSGLEPGAWHYDPRGHRLARVPAAAESVQGLLDGTRWMMDERAAPQVLLVLTARFGRVQWKYEGVAYALILKEVGVLFEAMYLAATVMRLAPCALGGGDSARIISTLNLDPLAEGPVGEFVLGTRA